MKITLVLLVFSNYLMRSSAQMEKYINSLDIKKPYSGYSIFSTIPKTEENLRLLWELDGIASDRCMEVLIKSGAPNKSVQVLAHPELSRNLENLFQERNMTFKVNAVSLMVEKERQEISNRRKEFEARCNESESGCLFDFFNYNEFERIEKYLLELSDNKEMFKSTKNIDVDVIKVGSSYENRTIKMVSISLERNETKRKKNAIMLECCEHAREWVTPAFCLYVINNLINGRSDVLQDYDFYIIPVVNPDGYVYSWTDEEDSRLWRRTRSPNYNGENRKKLRGLPEPICTGKPFGWSNQLLNALYRFRSSSTVRTSRPIFSNKKHIKQSTKYLPQDEPAQNPHPCVGTDTNRNYDIFWGNKLGASDWFCDDAYHGAKPFSESETRAVRDAVLMIQKNKSLISFVAVHSSGELWMYPYGLTKFTSEYNVSLNEVANASVRAILDVNGREFTIGTVFEAIKYQASGGSMDWAHLKAAIKYAYALEMGPIEFGFMLPLKLLKPTLEETWAGIKAMAMTIKKTDSTPFFHYRLSPVGEFCTVKVKTEDACHEAGIELLNATYVEAAGDGHDLPCGCIWDAVTPDKYFTYWNPKGVTISRDPKIRQICYDSGTLHYLDTSTCPVSGMPRFEILKKPISTNMLEPPLIKVTFENGEQDYFELSPIKTNGQPPKGCNYLGRLRNSPSTSSIAVTGCLDKPGDSLEITMISDHSIHRMFTIDYYGNTEIIEPPNPHNSN